jgi:hypothetical protein
MQSQEHKKALQQLEESQTSLQIAQKSLKELENEKFKIKFTTISITFGLGFIAGSVLVAVLNR